MKQTQESVNSEGLRMSDSRLSARGPELGRWIVVAGLLLIGLVLYFVFAPSSEPPAPPAAEDVR